MPLGPRLGLQQHGHFVDCAFQIKGFGVERQPFRLDLGIVQNVVDDDQKRLTRGFDGFGKQPLFLGQGAVAQQFRHAHHAVHRRADLVAHIGEEGRFGAVGGLGRLARGQQGGLLFLGFGDVHRAGRHGRHPASDGPACGSSGHRPAAVPCGPPGLWCCSMPFGQPFLLAPLGVGVLAMGQTIAQDILELGARAGWRGPRRHRCHGSVGCRSKADPPCRKAQIHPESPRSRPRCASVR